MAETLALIGTGTMGAAIGSHLLDEGSLLSVWNRTTERAADLTSRSATAAGTPAEAARDAGVVLVAVGDAQALDEVSGGEEGFLAGLREGTIVIVLATVPPRSVRRLEEAVSACGAGLLDCGMLGNARMAAGGQLRLYVGGDAPVLERARPVLELIGGEVRHVGGVGSGMALKIALNLILGVELAAMAEAIALASKLGLDRELVADAIAQSGVSSPVMGFRAPRMSAGRYGNPDFRLSLMHKDLVLATELAAEAGLELLVTNAVRDLNALGLSKGHGDLDAAVVLEVVAPSGGGSA